MYGQKFIRFLASGFLCTCEIFALIFTVFSIFLHFFNCSQTKFVAIILVLSVFFSAIFRLTNFSSDAFDLSSSKTG